ERPHECCFGLRRNSGVEEIADFRQNTDGYRYGFPVFAPPIYHTLVPCVASIDERVEGTGVGDNRHSCGFRQRSSSTTAAVFLFPLANLPAMEGSRSAGEGSAR